MRTIPDELLEQRPPSNDSRGSCVGGQMAGVNLKAVQSENLGADRFGSVSVREKTAWPDADGDDRSRSLSFKRTHFKRPFLRQAATVGCYGVCILEHGDFVANAVRK